MSTKLIKEEKNVQKNLFTTKNVGCVIAMLFVVVALGIAIKNTSGHNLSTKYVTYNDLSPEDVISHIDQMGFKDVIDHIVAVENKQAAKNNYAVVYDFNYINFDEPEGDEYTFVLKHSYPDANDINIYDMQIEYHIVKTPEFFNINTTAYAITFDGTPLNDKTITDYFQYCYIDNMFKFTNEE